jgi:hypothetical protein
MVGACSFAGGFLVALLAAMLLSWGQSALKAENEELQTELTARRADLTALEAKLKRQEAEISRLQTALEKQKAATARPSSGDGTPGGAYAAAKDFVRERLTSPSTAKFPFFPPNTPEYREGKWHVRGHVDSGNSSDAMVRTNWTAVLFTTDGDQWTLESIDME